MKEQVYVKVSDNAEETNAKNCVILGLSEHNGISLDNILDLRGMSNLLVVDLDYYLDYPTDVLLAVKSIKNI